MSKTCFLGFVCKISQQGHALKNQGALEHHLGHFLCSNIAKIEDSIVGGFKYPPTISPNLVMNSSALRWA
jgi:hypothetical protein